MAFACTVGLVATRRVRRHAGGGGRTWSFIWTRRSGVRIVVESPVGGAIEEPNVHGHREFVLAHAEPHKEGPCFVRRRPARSRARRTTVPFREGRDPADGAPDQSALGIRPARRRFGTSSWRWPTGARRGPARDRGSAWSTNRSARRRPGSYGMGRGRRWFRRRSLGRDAQRLQETVARKNALLPCHVATSFRALLGADRGAAESYGNVFQTVGSHPRNIDPSNSPGGIHSPISRAPLGGAADRLRRPAYAGGSRTLYRRSRHSARSARLIAWSPARLARRGEVAT